MQDHLWEWIAVIPGKNDTVGISGTWHGATKALSRSLKASGGIAHGQVIPVKLRDGIRGLYYLRDAPLLTAAYDGQSIQWITEGCYPHGYRDNQGMG